MRIQKSGLIAWSLAAWMSLSGLSAFSAQIDMLRRIPLPVEAYASGRAFPERFNTAQEVLRVVENTPVPLVHMEALRRTYEELPPAEQEKLLRALSARHKAQENDRTRFFDLGYAQLILKNNKSGLFFLRKAGDAIDSPYAAFFNLAYGMAQVEADLTLEGAQPDQITVRKMDATYRLSDAVQLDARRHQSGFWPTFVRVIEVMKGIPAYHSFVRRDFSLVYVPSGKKAMLPAGGAAAPLPPVETPPASNFRAAGSSPASCSPDGDGTTMAPDVTPLLFQQSANFNGEAMQIRFSGTGENHRYRVRVVDASGRPVLSFLTYALPGPILEDLEGDGIPEVVARQYAYDPMHPVLVYRHTPCGLEVDSKISSRFQ